MKKEWILSFYIRYRVAIPSFDIRDSILDILRFVFQNDPNHHEEPASGGRGGIDSGFPDTTSFSLLSFFRGGTALIGNR